MRPPIQLLFEVTFEGNNKPCDVTCALSFAKVCDSKSLHILLHTQFQIPILSNPELKVRIEPLADESQTLEMRVFSTENIHFNRSL